MITITIMNTQQTCEYLSLSKSSLYKLTSKREIPFSKPNGGKLYFKKEDLDKWLLSNMSKSKEELKKGMFNILNERNAKKKDK